MLKENAGLLPMISKTLGQLRHHTKGSLQKKTSTKFVHRCVSLCKIKIFKHIFVPIYFSIFDFSSFFSTFLWLFRGLYWTMGDPRGLFRTMRDPTDHTDY